MNPSASPEHRPRIAIVAATYPPRFSGGIASAHVNLFQALKARGHEVRFFTHKDFDRKGLPVEADVVRTGIPPFLGNLAYRVWRLRYWRERDTGLIAHQAAPTTKGAVAGWFLAPRIRRYRPDIVVFPDHCAPGAFYRKRGREKIVLVAHHNSSRFSGEPLIGSLSAKDARMAVRIEQRAVDRADVVVCPSRYMRDVFARTYRYDGPMHVIPNLVELSYIDEIPRTDLRERLGLGPEAPIVYVPSAASIYKGARFVPEIVRRLALAYDGPIGFYLSGPRDGAWDQLATFLPANARLHVAGPVSYAENIGAVKASDVCVSPTLLENFSMALIEAMACGMPVVAFDVGGNGELVDEGVTGNLVPAGDVEALIARALGLLRDGATRRRMGEVAIRQVHKQLSADVVLDAYLGLFDACTRGEG